MAETYKMKKKGCLISILLIAAAIFAVSVFFGDALAEKGRQIYENVTVYRLSGVDIFSGEYRWSRENVPQRDGFYRRSLNDGEQYIYDLTASCLEQRLVSVSFYKGCSTERFKQIVDYVLYDNPIFFDIEQYSYELVGDTVKTFIPIYELSKAEYRGRLRELEEVCESFALSAEGMSEYEKAKAAHDYIINTCSYDSSLEAPDRSGVYGALIRGNATCAGFANSYKLLLDSVGVECICVSGYAGEAHRWNLVQIDGDFFYVDVTWDDYVLPDERDTLRHSYFLIDGESLFVTHTADSDGPPLPECITSDMSYFEREGLCGASFSDFERGFIDFLVNNYIETGIMFAEGKFTDRAAYIQYITLGNDKFFACFREACARLSARGYTPPPVQSLYISNNDEMMCFAVTLK